MADPKTKIRLAINGDAHRLDDILLAAAEMICNRGFDATSMKDIAEAVGMTKAGIYHYIPGKEELLYAIMDFAMEQLEVKVIATARLVEDPERRLSQIISSHVKLLTGPHKDKTFGHLSILTDELGGLTAEHRAEIVGRKRAYLELVRETLEQLRSKGKLKDLDANTGAFCLFGMIMWIARWYRPGGSLSGEQLAGQIKLIALSGLLK